MMWISPWAAGPVRGEVRVLGGACGVACADASGNFGAAYLLLSGGFTGIFIGKYCRCLQRCARVCPAIWARYP